MKEYVLELSEDSFNSMMKTFDTLKRNIPKIENKILKALSEYAKERMIYYINTSVNEEYATGNLANSIIIEQLQQSEVIVKVDENQCPYAIYVEYGTGIVGASNPHPNGGEYKSEGWWYPTTANDPNPAKKQLENGDWIVYTKGQKAHKFVYNAFQDLMQNYMSITRKILKEEGLI